MDKNMAYIAGLFVNVISQCTNLNSIVRKFRSLCQSTGQATFQYNSIFKSVIFILNDVFRYLLEVWPEMVQQTSMPLSIFY